MKIKILSLLMLLFCFISCSAIPSSPEKLGHKDLSFTPKKTVSWTLNNGLKVIYLRNEEVPVVKASIYFPGGSLWDPKGLEGLSSATGALLREGGTLNLSPDELDNKLAGLAAEIEGSFLGEVSSLSLFSLEDNLGEVFEIFSDILRKPRFDQTRFQLWKELSKNSIQNRKDSPETIAGMAFSQLIYGKDSPYGSSSSLESLKRIDIPKIKNFYTSYFGPSNAILAISGSASQDKVERIVRKNFASWSGPFKTFSDLPSFNSTQMEDFKPGVYLLEKKLPQSVILIGHRGPKRLTKDWYALQIFNKIYGHGGFESKLFNHIRTELGLAYSVYGGFSPAKEVGHFKVYAATRNEEVLKTIDEILKLTKKQKTERQDKAEVETAKLSQVKNFVFKFSTPEALIERETLLELLGFPDDYNQKFVSRIKSVEPQDVDNIARKYLSDEMVIVIVGGSSNKELKDFLSKNENLNLPVYNLGFDTSPYLLDTPR